MGRELHDPIWRCAVASALLLSLIGMAFAQTNDTITIVFNPLLQNFTCTSNTNCTPLVCNFTTGSCVPCASNDPCTTGLCISGVCVNCTDSSQCPNGWICDNATGSCFGKPYGSRCSNGIECDSQICRFGASGPGICSYCMTNFDCPANSACDAAGVCVSLIRPQLGSPGSTSRASVQQVTLVQEVERKTASQSILALFNISRIRTEATSNCIRGAQCSSPGDCCGGGCADSQCVCSTTACTATGDCCSGYCSKGKCGLPPTTSLFLFSSLKSGTQLGCAGLIEECSPDETNCVSICGGLSMLLVLVSCGFGAYAWRKYDNPVAGLIAAFAPIVTGLITYPFVGIIIGIVLFAMLLSRSLGGINQVV